MSYLANLVKGCPLFHEIYDEEVEQIIETCDVATFKKGEAIIKQGEESSDIAIILSGSASVVIKDKYNKEKVVSQINSGELFGELVLINETRRTADIVAKEDTNILIISYNDFYSFFNDNPKVFALMVLNVTRMVTTRLKAANNIINNLSHELQEAKEDSSKKAS